MVIAPTTGPGTATGLARQHIMEGADLVIGAGGDGTINEIVEGIAGSQAHLALLPAGTANVLAAEMQLGRSLQGAAERLEECRPHRISLGHVTCDAGRVSRHFLLMAGIGLDAHIVYSVSASLKARTGKFAYWLAGWNVLGRPLPEFQLDIGAETRRCSFALLSKVRNYGGDFEIARNVSLFDHEFEAVLFEGRSSLPYLKYLAGVALNRLAGLKGVSVIRTDRVRISAPEDSRVFVQVDGEFAGHLPAEVRIVPDALTLMIPPEYAARHTAGVTPSTIKER